MRSAKAIPVVLAALVALAGAALLTAQEEQPLQAGSEGVPVPKKTKHVQPVYPAEALAQGIRGIVILDLVIDKSGKVENTSVLRSVPGLDEAAIAAARQWEYEPAKLDGKPIRVRLTVPITFSLALPRLQRQSGVPELRQGVTPAFPKDAQGSGSASAEVTLESDGRVGVARLLSGEAPWSEALLAALKTWRFSTPPDDAVLSFRVEADFVKSKGNEPSVVDLRATGLQRSEMLADSSAPAPPPAPAAAPQAPPSQAPAAPKPTPAAPAAAGPGPAASAPAPVKPTPAAPSAAAPPTAASGPAAPAAPTPKPTPAAPAPATPAPASAPAPKAAAPAAATPEAPKPAQPAPLPRPTPAAPPAAGDKARAAGAPANPAPTGTAPAAAGGATSVAAAGSATTAPPPVEVITAPPPTLPPENGVSAVREVTLEAGVPDLSRGRRPVVPPVARLNGTTGTVEVLFSVSAGGVTALQTATGPDILRFSAEQTVASWVFTRQRAERAYLIATFTYGPDKGSAVVRPQQQPKPTDAPATPPRSSGPATPPGP